MKFRILLNPRCFDSAGRGASDSLSMHDYVTRLFYYEKRDY
jgi:hypothetical protein